MTAISAHLRKAALEAALRLTAGGRFYRATAEASGRAERMIAHGKEAAVARSLWWLIRFGLLTHREASHRVGALFDAGRADVAWFLLKSAQLAAPSSHILTGRRLKLLAIEGRHDELRREAEGHLAHSTDPELLLHIVAALESIGIDPADPLAIRAGAAFERAIAGRNDAESLQDRLYDKMGFGALQRWRRMGESENNWPIGEILAASRWDDPLTDAVRDAFAENDPSPVAYTADNRLLLVGNSLACGGMERVLAKTYRHFSEGETFDRVDLTLLTFKPDDASAFYADMGGVSPADVMVLDRNHPSEGAMARLPANLAGRAQQLFDHIRRTRPRVIHAWNDQVGVIAAYAGLLAGCPKVIVHFHHTPLVPLASRTGFADSLPAVYRTLLTRPAFHPVFCAKAAASAYADWWGVPHGPRFRTLYNGFEWDEGPAKAAAKGALGLAPEMPVIGTVLRFHDVKQPHLWAEAAIALASTNPAARFLMVGDGPLQEETAARFEAAGLADALIMPGRVENVGDYYAAMDAFWLTSQSEGLPNVCIEAQFFGVPVVAFDVGGMGETFVDGRTGFLVPPNDAAALASRTAELLADLAQAGQMGRDARRFARETFAADRYFTELTEIYDTP